MRIFFVVNRSYPQGHEFVGESIEELGFVEEHLQNWSVRDITVEDADLLISAYCGDDLICNQEDHYPGFANWCRTEGLDPSLVESILVKTIVGEAETWAYRIVDQIES